MRSSLSDIEILERLSEGNFGAVYRSVLSFSKSLYLLFIVSFKRNVEQDDASCIEETSLLTDQ